MKRLATASLILTALVFGSCDSRDKVLGSIDNVNSPPGAATTPQNPTPQNPTTPPPNPTTPPAPPVPPEPPPEPPMGPNLVVPRPPLPPTPLSPPTAPPLAMPPDYPPGPYGYFAGLTLANFPFTTRDNLPFSPDVARKTAGVKVILLLQTTEGCCPIVRRLNEINDEFAPRGLLLVQLITHDRSGQAASAQTLIDWDSETGYGGLSVFGQPMKTLNGFAAGAPTLVVAHAKDLKIQTFAARTALGGFDEIRAAVEAALASAP